ncbi:MAG: hypothetical protein JSV44_01345 [Candidatus Zixiibacteriota bacterium]|nr:MAG: hypothetical protein JSV44_01345 [candidate division Zixibacteria bacterium]
MRRHCKFIRYFLLLLATASIAGSIDPITDEDFNSHSAGQQVDLQNELVRIFRESDGFITIGPLSPVTYPESVADSFWSSVRVIGSGFRHYRDALDILNAPDKFHHIINNVRGLEADFDVIVPGFRGTVIEVNWAGGITWIQFLSPQQMRFALWLHDTRKRAGRNFDNAAFAGYVLAVSGYLAEIENGNFEAPEPKSQDYGLPDSLDLYAADPDYVIQGYRNFKDSLYSHAELQTDFAQGITAFIPTKETLEYMKASAFPEAYPNKEAPKLQEELREFFRRGGKLHTMQTLTKEGFDTLGTGEYFFAVGLSGKIRFGRELEREEVERIERETRQKVPRANHAFLFPGEPVLTAGAFFIDKRADQKLVRVNAQSGHYFYSNIHESIYDDIAKKSDRYLMSLGHFFKALDLLKIDYEGILISKL